MLKNFECILDNIIKFLAGSGSFLINCAITCFNGLIKLFEIIGSYLSEFINFSNGNKIAIFCGITAIIAPYIIFIAEIISTKDKERNKTFKRIVLQDSWILKQLFLIMGIFILMFGTSEKTYVANAIVIFLITIEIIIFFWRFIIILSILKSSKFYKNRRIKYIGKMMDLYKRNNVKSNNVISDNLKKFEELHLSNIKYDKYCFDFREEYEKKVADKDGIIWGINKINLRDIDSILKNNGSDEINNLKSKKTESSNLLISCVDGEYIKKGYTIAYIPKKHQDLISKFSKIEIKSERNNNEIITDIFKDYLDDFSRNCDNSSSYLSEESYFDYYEFACMILDSDNSDLIILLEDSIRKLRFSVNRKSKTSINNIISICKNLLIYDSKKSNCHYDFETSMIDTITYESFYLLSICKDDSARKSEAKFYVQNIASFIDYEFKSKRVDIRNYFYTSVSEYVKLLSCSEYPEKIELINIVVKNLSFSKNDYDIWTIIHNKQFIRKYKSKKKIELINNNIKKLRYNIDLVNSFSLTTLLAIMYGNFEKDDMYYDMLLKVVDCAQYGYDLEELLLTFLNFNKASKEVINRWGIVENPYDIVSDYNTIELNEALILLLNIGSIYNCELSDELIDINYKFFFEGLIKQLKNMLDSDNMDNRMANKNGSLNQIIDAISVAYEMIIKKEKENIINAKLDTNIILKFKSSISKLSKKGNIIYNYYLNHKLFINGRKQFDKYNGYNTIIDKDIILSYDYFAGNLADDYRDGLLRYNEKIIFDEMIKCTAKIDANSVEEAIETSIDNLLKEKVESKDILILSDFIYSSKITKNGKFYKYNGIKYRIVKDLNTNNKIYVVNKNNLPKIINYKFTDRDLTKLNASENDLIDNGYLLVKIIDLSHNAFERKRIIEEKPEWLEKEENKEDYIKTKVSLMILQKVDIQKVETTIGYNFEN